MIQFTETQQKRYFITRVGEAVSESKKTGIRKTLVAPPNSITGYRNINVGRKQYKIHRLVATYYVSGNTCGTLHVDHIDEDKLNNNWSNLQWLSCGDNTRRSTYKQSKNRAPKPTTVNGVLYPNMKAAATFIHEDSGKSSVKTISTSIWQFHKGMKQAWAMYGKYHIS